MQNKFKLRTACANVSENISSRDAQHKSRKMQGETIHTHIETKQPYTTLHFVRSRY